VIDIRDLRRHAVADKDSVCSDLEEARVTGKP